MAPLILDAAKLLMTMCGFRGEDKYSLQTCYEQEKCGELVDKRELEELILHETDHKPNPHTPESDKKRIQTRNW
jgi:hypothetical protein